MLPSWGSKGFGWVLLQGPADPAPSQWGSLFLSVLLKSCLLCRVKSKRNVEIELCESTPVWHRICLIGHYTSCWKTRQ